MLLRFLGPTYLGLRACPAALLPYAAQTRWVVWRYSHTGRRKAAKIPHLPHSGRPADATHMYAGATFIDAARALRDGRWRRADDGRWYLQRYDGIGLFLGNGLAGIDFDHCVDAQGTVAPRVQADLDALDSYTEYSASGTGVHVLALGELPASWKTDYCEGYARDRFFVVTGRGVPGSPDAVRASQGAFDTLFAQWGNAPADQTPGTSDPDCPVARDTIPERESPGAGLDQGFVAWLRARRNRLLDRSGRPHGCTRQLRDLLDQDVLPAALAAKGNSASERRALVVRQLALAGYLPEEIAVIAWAIWQRHGYLTKDARAMRRDLYQYLLPVEGQVVHVSQHSQARYEEYQRGLTLPHRPAPTTPSPCRPRPARVTAADYLELLAQLATDGTVALTRAQRALAAGVSTKTAQRREDELIADGQIRLRRVVTASGVQSVIDLCAQPQEAGVHTPAPALPSATHRPLRHRMHRGDTRVVFPALGVPCPSPGCPSVVGGVSLCVPGVSVVPEPAPEPARALVGSVGGAAPFDVRGWLRRNRELDRGGVP